MHFKVALQKANHSGPIGTFFPWNVWSVTLLTPAAGLCVRQCTTGRPFFRTGSMATHGPDPIQPEGCDSHFKDYCESLGSCNYLQPPVAATLLQ
jgi:hypothetical protein